MDETRRAWDEVGDGFVRLGRIISERYRRLGEGQVPAAGSAEGSGLGDAIRRATDDLDRAFTSLGDTMRDDEARQHVRDTGRKLSDALRITLAEVGEEVRQAVGSRRSPGPGDHTTPAPPPGPPADPPPGPPADPGPPAAPAAGPPADPGAPA